MATYDFKLKEHSSIPKPEGPVRAQGVMAARSGVLCGGEGAARPAGARP